MYVMQSLPPHQQALAGGIFNTIFRLSSAIALGLSTAVFSSTKGSTVAMADIMVPYEKAFQVSIGLSAGSFLFLPFVRLGTQGHVPKSVDADTSDGIQTPPSVVLEGEPSGGEKQERVSKREKK